MCSAHRHLRAEQKKRANLDKHYTAQASAPLSLWGAEIFFQIELKYTSEHFKHAHSSWRGSSSLIEGTRSSFASDGCQRGCCYAGALPALWFSDAEPQSLCSSPPGKTAASEETRTRACTQLICTQTQWVHRNSNSSSLKENSRNKNTKHKPSFVHCWLADYFFRFCEC